MLRRDMGLSWVENERRATSYAEQRKSSSIDAQLRRGGRPPSRVALSGANLRLLPRGSARAFAARGPPHPEIPGCAARTKVAPTVPLPKWAELG